MQIVFAMYFWKLEQKVSSSKAGQTTASNVELSVIRLDIVKATSINIELDMPSQCKTCSQASTIELLMPQESSFAFSCCKGKEHPQIA